MDFHRGSNLGQKTLRKKRNMHVTFLPFRNRMLRYVTLFM